MKSFTFGAGGHEKREDGMCVMETVAFLAGEEHTARPRCASRTIGGLAMFLNDRCDDNLRQELCQDLPWRIVGTHNPAMESKRQEMLAAYQDWLMWEYCVVDSPSCIYNAWLCALRTGKQTEFLYRLKKVINEMIDLTEIKETVSEKTILETVV